MLIVQGIGAPHGSNMEPQLGSNDKCARERRRREVGDRMDVQIALSSAGSTICVGGAHEDVNCRYLTGRKAGFAMHLMYHEDDGIRQVP